eukprot:gene26497-biopygen16674
MLPEHQDSSDVQAGCERVIQVSTVLLGDSVRRHHILYVIGPAHK